MLHNHPHLASAAAALRSSVRRLFHVAMALTLLASVLSLVSYELPHAEAQATQDEQQQEESASDDSDAVDDEAAGDEAADEEAAADDEASTDDQQPMTATETGDGESEADGTDTAGDEDEANLAGGGQQKILTIAPPRAAAKAAR